MTEYNSLMMESVINRISQLYERRVPTNLSCGILHKLCYMVDFEYYRRYERFLTGETYVRTRNGPVPIHFNKAVDELITDGRLHEGRGDELMPSSGLCKNRMYAEAPPTRNMNTLDDEWAGIAYHILPELPEGADEIIQRVVDEHIGKTARELEPVVKADPPYMMASEAQAIDYELVFYRNDEEVSE